MTKFDFDAFRSENQGIDALLLGMAGASSIQDRDYWDYTLQAFTSGDATRCLNDLEKLQSWSDEKLLTLWKASEPDIWISHGHGVRMFLSEAVEQIASRFPGITKQR